MMMGSPSYPSDPMIDQHSLDTIGEAGPLLPKSVDPIDRDNDNDNDDDDDDDGDNVDRLHHYTAQRPSIIGLPNHKIPKWMASSSLLKPIIDQITSQPRANQQFQSNRNVINLTRKTLLSQVLFLLVWFILNLGLIRRSWFTSRVTQPDHFPQPAQPDWLECVESYWSKDDGCGLNGEKCLEDIRNVTLPFRCPSRCGTGTGLLNPRVVGTEILNYRPLVVGGGDISRRYRPDSFICQSAVHAGVISSRWGGCGVLRMLDETIDFKPARANGIDSVGFPAPFPASFIFLENVDQRGCNDLWIPIILLNFFFSLLFTLFFSHSPKMFFWVLCVVGYGTVVVASEPSTLPPSLSKAARDFLPFLFVCYWLWNVAWGKVVESVNRLDRIWVYILPWWLGLLLNLVFGWVPIDRLTTHDITQRPGGILALSIVAILTISLTAYQVWCLKKANRFQKLRLPYAALAVVLVLLSFIPEHSLRLHHYISGILLSPLTSIATKSSGMFQGFFLGIIQNGLARWSFGSIIEKTNEVFGDRYDSQDQMPEFDLLNSGLINNSRDLRIAWKPINGTDGTELNIVGLMVNDILRFIIRQSTSIIIENLLHNFTVPITTTTKVDRFYFRLAFFENNHNNHHRYHRISEFTGPVVFFVNNQSWVGPISVQ